MEMSDMIKQQRELHDWSQDDLGQMLKPPVNRAAVQKWEKGTVENIKRTYIEQMSKLFNISPYELMCFDDDQDETEDQQQKQICDLMRNCYGKESYEIVKMYLGMNSEGKQLAYNLMKNLFSNPANTSQKNFKIG